LVYFMASFPVGNWVLLQGCQIFLGAWCQNRKKCTKCAQCTEWSQNIPNIHKILQMAIKYISIFQSEASQIGIFGLKTNHLATLFYPPKDNFQSFRLQR
jgi:hypothetical protein